MAQMKVYAVIDTSGEPMKLYCNSRDFVWAYKVYSNCRAFIDKQQYWITPRLITKYELVTKK